MSSNKGDFAVIGIAFFSVFGGLFAAFYALASSLTPSALAITLTLIVVFGVVIALPLLWIVARLTRERRGDEVRRELTATTYQGADAYASTKPPEVIDVRRHFNYNEARPLLPAKPAEPTLRTATDTGDEVTIGGALAIRFAELPTPARAEWYGDKAAYGQAARFFDAHGMLSRDNRNGWRWKEEFSDASGRVAFIRQFFTAASTPARERAR